MRRIKSVIALLAILCMTLQASAQEIIIYSITAVQNTLKISGKVSASQNEEVLLRVTAQDSGMDGLVYLEQKTAGEDGSFEFEFELPDEASGEDGFKPEKYEISIGAMNAGAEVKEIKEHYGKAYGEYVVKTVNNAKQEKNVGMLEKIMEEASERLLFDISVYNEYINGGGKASEIAEKMVDYDKISDIDEMAYQMNRISALNILEGINISETERLKSFLSNESYRKYLGFEESTAYGLFNILEKYRTEIAVKFKAKTAGGGDPQKAFEFAVIAVGLKNAVSYADVKNVLNGNDKILGITLANYGLTNEQLAKLAGAEINDLGDIKGLLEKAAASGSKPSGGGGGGSGSSSGGGSMIIGKTSDNTLPENIETVNPFKDLGGYEWARESIVNLYKKKIISGITSESFAPGNTVTREEFVKMLVGAANIVSYDGKIPPFNDVESGTWYFPYVRDAYFSGIVLGDENGSFGTGRYIKREDIAVMLKRYCFPNTSAAEEIPFDDESDISEYAKESVSVLKSKGIMKGTETNRFNPQAYATRAETAVLINRITELSLSGGI